MTCSSFLPPRLRPHARERTLGLIATNTIAKEIPAFYWTSLDLQEWRCNLLRVDGSSGLEKLPSS